MPCQWCQGGCEAATECPAVAKKFDDHVYPAVSAGVRRFLSGIYDEVIGYSWDVWLSIVQSKGIDHFDDDREGMLKYFIVSLSKSYKPVNEFTTITDEILSTAIMDDTFPLDMEGLTLEQRAFVLLKTAGFKTVELIKIGLIANRMEATRIRQEIKKNKDFSLQN